MALLCFREKERKEETQIGKKEILKKRGKTIKKMITSKRKAGTLLRICRVIGCERRA